MTAMAYIDLHPALRDWPYEPDKISVRKILGVDGGVRIQMRIELGILQMEGEGRPDGGRPHGRESLLSYHTEALTQHQECTGTSLAFGLSTDECYELRIEASQYYRRYVANFVLEDFELVFRDTTHNLGILDICRDHALDRDDRTALEEFRPYVLMMDARGRAYHALEDGETASALAHVNRGIMQIKVHHEEFSNVEATQCSEELRILRALAADLGPQMPKDSILVTRKALRTAVEQEKFEEAARLRDTLKSLYDHKA